MAVLRQFIQCIKNPASQPDKFSLPDPHLIRNRIRGLKSDPPDIICQTVGILLNDLNTLTAIRLENLRGMGSTDLMALEKQHDILDLLLLLPAVLNALHANLSDPFHFNQRIRMFLDYIQRILPELLHDPPGKLRPDPFDQPGTEIFFNAIDRRRKRLLKLLHRKLPAVLGIHFPEALQCQHRPHMRIRHDSHNRHQVIVILHGALQHRVAVLCILICNSLYHTAQVLHKYPFLSQCKPESGNVCRTPLTHRFVLCTLEAGDAYPHSNMTIFSRGSFPGNKSLQSISSENSSSSTVISQEIYSSDG